MNYNQDDVRLVALSMITECIVSSYEMSDYNSVCAYCDGGDDNPRNIIHSKGCPVLVAKKLLEVK